MCGVCGAVEVRQTGSHLAAALVVHQLQMLQHRGQQSAGLAVVCDGQPKCKKGLGLVGAVFADEEEIRSFTGHLAVGHNRYSTSGGLGLEGAHPHCKSGRFEVALVHNGNLVNTCSLQQHLRQKGIPLESDSDSEAVAAMIAHSRATTLEEAVVETCLQLRGAYSMLILAPDRIVAVRDPHGIRPLELGHLVNSDGEFWVVASETCAWSGLGLTVAVREIAPGEVLTIYPDGKMRSRSLPVEPSPCLCAFEYIYLARPDSELRGRLVRDVRKELGRQLARESRPCLPAYDLITAVPDSGIPHGEGFAAELGVQLTTGFVKNHYIGRTFIKPNGRRRGVRQKLSPLRLTLRGERVVVVDDSIVRGTTTREEVELLREIGVREVHLQIASPQIRYPCFYGIDTATERELVASDETLLGLRQKLPLEFRELPPADVVGAWLGAESLGHLTLDGLIESIGLPLCLACFNGDHPISPEGR